LKVNHIVTVCLLFLLACADAGLAQRAKSKPKRKRQNLEEQLWTPLMQAAQEGRITTVRHLLRKGVDVNDKNGVGITALMLAARGDHLEVIRVLLAAGADPNAAGGFAHAPIFSVVAVSMKKNNKNWTEVIDTLIAGGARMNPPRDYPITPLNYAIEQRDVGMVRAILARGADANWKNSSGNTPLVTAIAVAEPKPEIVKVLLAARADPNIPRLWVGDQRRTLLSYLEGWLKESRDEDREEIVRMLKQAGAKE